MLLSKNPNYREYVLRLVQGDFAEARAALAACLAEAERDRDADTVLFLSTSAVELLFRENRLAEAKAALEQLSTTSPQSTSIMYAQAEMCFRFEKDPAQAVRLCHRLIAALFDHPLAETTTDFGRGYYIARALALRARCALQPDRADAAAADIATSLAITEGDHFPYGIEACQILVSTRRHVALAQRYLSSTLACIPPEPRYDAYRASIRSYLD